MERNVLAIVIHLAEKNDVIAPELVISQKNF